MLFSFLHRGASVYLKVSWPARNITRINSTLNPFPSGCDTFHEIIGFCQCILQIIQTAIVMFKCHPGLKKIFRIVQLDICCLLVGFASSSEISAAAVSSSVSLGQNVTGKQWRIGVRFIVRGRYPCRINFTILLRSFLPYLRSVIFTVMMFQLVTQAYTSGQTGNKDIVEKACAQKP